MQITIPDSVPEELHERFMEFWRDYTQAVAFTSMEDDEEGRGNSLFSGSGEFDDNHPDAWGTYAEHLTQQERDEMLTDAAGFFMEAKDLIEGEDARAGRDFHFTRNGHGAGFWDGDWDEHGNALTAMSKPYGSLELMGSIDEDDSLTRVYLYH